MTTTQQPTTTAAQNYTVFTRSRTDHSIVNVIAHEISGYAEAHELAKIKGASVMFSDQFHKCYQPINHPNHGIRP